MSLRNGYPARALASPTLTTKSSPQECPPRRPSSLATAYNSDARRKLYLYHEQVVTALSGKYEAYKTALTRAQTSAAALAQAEIDLAALRQQESSLERQLKTLEARRMHKVLFPNWMLCQLRTLRGQLAVVAEKVVDAKAEVRLKRRKARSDATKARRLRPDVELLHASERARGEILQRVYSGAMDRPVKEDAYLDFHKVCKVSVRAHHSLSAQEEAQKLLRTALMILEQGKTSLRELQIRCTSEQVCGGGVALGAATSAQYLFKMAGWKAREAGKKIERAVVLNDDLPIHSLVESSKGSLLAPDADVRPGVGAHVELQLTVLRALNRVHEVISCLQESLEVQDGVVESLRDNLMTVSELESTSNELLRLNSAPKTRSLCV